ncbi:MAG: hypothetical protein JNJ73_03710 [Hyphomonadaceae bacterium]|nr:hypothetical protein [Hyphomonadaceae bacterium]
MDFIANLIPLAAEPYPVSAPFSHERTLVGLSMLAAVLGSYTFLEAAARGKTHRGAAAVLWMACAGGVLGVCVWATHFLGLLAMETPLQHGFILAPTVISAIITVVSLGLCAAILGTKPSWAAVIVAGSAVGVCMIVMHYLGMQGLRIEAVLSYRPVPIVVTSIGALGAVVCAFLFAHHLDSSWLRGVLAFPMGAGIAGLHYTDMAATIITPRPAFASAPEAPVMLLSLAVTGGVVLAVAAALGAVVLDRKRAEARQAREEAQTDVVVIPHPARRSADADGGDTIIHIPDRTMRGR